VGGELPVASLPLTGQRTGRDAVVSTKFIKKNPLHVVFVNSLLVICHCGQIQSFVFDVFQETQYKLNGNETAAFKAYPSYDRKAPISH